MANPGVVRLAVLIDADNASASVVKELLEEVAKFGTAMSKRAYGDWTTQNLAGWKEHLHRHGIQPMQQFAYAKEKNAIDSALTIDAMDLLYAGDIDGFCLVSSDSDYARCRKWHEKDALFEASEPCDLGSLRPPPTPASALAAEGHCRSR